MKEENATKENVLNHKMILIGNCFAGKTSIQHRMFGEAFHNNDPVSLDFKIKNEEIEGQKIKLIIWDTAGQERFRTMLAPGYYRGSDVIVFVYDVTSQKKAEEELFWLNDVYTKIEQGELIPNAKELPLMMVVGNKIDLLPERKVNKLMLDVQAYCFDKKLDHLVCSAKNDKGIKEIIPLCCRSILESTGKIEKQKRELKSLPFFGKWSKEYHRYYPLNIRKSLELILLSHFIFKKNQVKRAGIWSVPKPILFKILAEVEVELIEPNKQLTEKQTTVETGNSLCRIF